MIDKKKLFDMYKKSFARNECKQNCSLGQEKKKKYNREIIINAECFNTTERNYLDSLLTDREYSFSEVKQLVISEIKKLEAEGVID